MKTAQLILKISLGAMYLYSGTDLFISPEDWEGFPLRKDYKVADYYHGVPIPKDKSYWE